LRDEIEAAFEVDTMARTYHYGVCIENRSHKAALDVRKIYRFTQDSSAAAHGLVRVVDESGEDFLYPARYFVPIELPTAVVRSFGERFPDAHFAGHWVGALHG